MRRKLDRQRCANNPHKYNADGTIKKGNREKWLRSKNYIKTLFQLKELLRKQAAMRKRDHEILANEIVQLGDEAKVETMRYDALAKREKETKISKKTGRFQRKKRFGKSIANKAPSMFLSILNQKLKYFGKTLFRINTQKVKASQYSHIENSYTKKTLGERWNEMQFKGTTIRVQRDLYSAFLIQHVDPNTLDEIDRKKCERHFENFLMLHDQEIERLKLKPSRKLASMGI